MGDTHSALDTAISRVAGKGIPLRGNSIDTDRIMPARYLRCVTFEGLENHVFEDDRKASAATPHPFDRDAYRGASVLVVNTNFGCGSSREHAPQGLRRWGIRAVVGESFAEIFAGNCVALGVPCVTLPPAEVDRIQSRLEADPFTEIVVDLEAEAVLVKGKSGAVEAFPARIPSGPRESFLRGTWDATAVLVSRPEEIEAIARSLPYVGGF